MNDLIEAADTADWEEFVRGMGGPLISRDRLPVAVLRVWTDEPDSYGDPKGYSVLGLETGDEHFVTRGLSWSVMSKKEAEVFDGRAVGPLEFCQ